MEFVDNRYSEQVILRYINQCHNNVLSHITYNDIKIDTVSPYTIRLNDGINLTDTMLRIVPMSNTTYLRGCYCVHIRRSPLRDVIGGIKIPHTLLDEISVEGVLSYLQKRGVPLDYKDLVLTRCTLHSTSRNNYWCNLVVDDNCALFKGYATINIYEQKKYLNELFPKGIVELKANDDINYVGIKVNKINGIVSTNSLVLNYKVVSEYYDNLMSLSPKPYLELSVDERQVIINMLKVHHWEWVNQNDPDKPSSNPKSHSLTGSVILYNGQCSDPSAGGYGHYLRTQSYLRMLVIQLDGRQCTGYDGVLRIFYETKDAPIRYNDTIHYNDEYQYKD